jgi:hypothetical protein
VEAMDFVMLTLLDAFQGEDEAALELLLPITEDRASSSNECGRTVWPKKATPRPPIARCCCTVGV